MILQDPRIRTVTAVLWALHPVGVEAVTNIVGRADLLAAAAVLGGLLLCIRGGPPGGSLREGKRIGDRGADSAVGRGIRQNDWRAVLRRALPFYAAIASALGILFVARYLVFRPLSWGEFPFVDNPLIAAGFVTARLTAMKVNGMQLALLVLPLHLSCDRSYDQIPVAIDPAAWVSLLVVLAVPAAVIVRRRRDPLLFWAAGFFGIALLAYRTYARNPDWTSELRLAQADVQTAPRSFKLHEMVAHARNQENAKGNIDRVIRHEEMAWEILQPVPARWSYQYVPVNLGGYYIVKGDVAGGAATAEGRGWYQKAVTVLPISAPP